MIDKYFTCLPALLLPWYETHHRDLPWRRDREPYHVWVSEVMLQQTRVEAVREKYLRFLRELPTVEALAECEDDKLMKLWEGLGYYSRARSLKKAANYIVTECGGIFPQTREELLKLPGVGEYTAGAIGSICFGLPTPAVDGNVLRVVSRFTGSEKPVTDPEVKKDISTRLEMIYPAGHCAEFTQALMELGATVCVPNGEPGCDDCPLREVCASRDGLWKKLPVRGEKKARREEQKTVFVLRCGGKLALRKRGATGLLAGLWELPNVEGKLDERAAWRLAEEWGTRPERLLLSSEKEHIFTHIRWDMVAYRIDCGREAEGFLWAEQEKLEKEYSLPTAFRKFRDL